MARETEKQARINFQLARQAFKENLIYYNNDIRVNIAFEEPKNNANEFSISLVAKRTTDNTGIIRTRIAIEQHHGSRHNKPHIEIKNFNTDQSLADSGNLYITLQVSSIEELNHCINGFVYKISLVLETIENIYGQKLNLSEYFFYKEYLTELQKYSSELDILLYNSLKTHILAKNDSSIELIEYKGRNLNDTLDTRDYIKILVTVIRLRYLCPIILDPLITFILEQKRINDITDKNLFIQHLLNRDNEHYEHYTEKSLDNDLSSCKKTS